MTTPNDIEILIHCHCRPEVHPRIDAPAVQETMKRFIVDGIIEQYKTEKYFITTEKGDAWLKLILQVPYPKQAWVDSNNKIIE
jgi:DNA-binding PadR family transcriptional regulator